MVRKKITEYDFPKDINDMSQEELILLSYEIRDFLISNIAKTGGHLASNLGIVEITLALHKVFDISDGDKVVWDVGHQAYVHKILTGRAGDFHTLRQKDGLSGFPKTSESDMDVYDSGHSSTSISAAMGIAEARDNLGEDYHVIALIGDGALTGGLAYEGLNNAGNAKTNMIVILNDNEMSISENIGSVSQHLNNLRASKTYLNMKKSLKKTITGIPGIGKSLYDGLDHVRSLLRYAVISESIFEDMGFSYYGPVNGNDIGEMIEILSAVKDIDGPVLIHTVTQKGKGYLNAEKNPSKFHGIGPFDPETGREVGIGQKNDELSLSSLCGSKLIEFAEKDSKIAAITAAMAGGTGLSAFAERFPDRFFDVGIAESHAVTFAAGLAIGGMKPFVCIYSTFLQRAYDQIVMDVSLQNLPVVFMIDRAGNVGADGDTHHGVFDISFMSHIPNMIVLAPSSSAEMEQMMEFAANYDKGPVAIRYPKAVSAVKKDISLIKNHLLSYGVDDNIILLPNITVKDGQDLAIVAVGTMLEQSLLAAKILAKKGIHARVISVRSIKPFDRHSADSLGREGIPVLTIEDNIISGGYGEKVAAFFAENEYSNKITRMGWPDQFIPQGAIPELQKEYGMNADAIAERSLSLITTSEKTIERTPRRTARK